MLAVVHDEEDVPSSRGASLAAAGGGCKRERTYGRQESSRLLARALSDAGLSHESAARALGVSRQLVGYKSDPSRTEHATIADVINLIDAGGAAADAGESLVRQLQGRIEERRGRSAPPSSMLFRLMLFITSIAGEMAAHVATVRGEPNADTRGKLLDLCWALHAQLGQLEACLKGTGT